MDFTHIDHLYITVVDSDSNNVFEDRYVFTVFIEGVTYICAKALNPATDTTLISSIRYVVFENEELLLKEVEDENLISKINDFVLNHDY